MNPFIEQARKDKTSYGEQSSGLPRGKHWRRISTYKDSMREFFEVTELSRVLIVIVVTQMYTYIQVHNCTLILKISLNQ